MVTRTTRSKLPKDTSRMFPVRIPQGFLRRLQREARQQKTPVAALLRGYAAAVLTLPAGQRARIVEELQEGTFGTDQAQWELKLVRTEK